MFAHRINNNEYSISDVNYDSEPVRLILVYRNENMRQITDARITVLLDCFSKESLDTFIRSLTSRSLHLFEEE